MLVDDVKVNRMKVYITVCPCIHINFVHLLEAVEDSGQDENEEDMEENNPLDVVDAGTCQNSCIDPLHVRCSTAVTMLLLACDL